LRGRYICKQNNPLVNNPTRAESLQRFCQQTLTAWIATPPTLLCDRDRKDIPR